MTEPQRRRIGSVPVDRGGSSVKRRLSEAGLSFANDRAVGSVTHGEPRRVQSGLVRQTRRSQSSVCRCRTEPGAPRTYERRRTKDVRSVLHEEESSRPKGPTHTERLAKLTRTRSLSAPPVYRGPSRREVTGQAGVPKDPPLPLDVPLRQGRASARPMSSRRRRREARRRRPACI